LNQISFGTQLYRIPLSFILADYKETDEFMEEIVEKYKKLGIIKKFESSTKHW